MDNKADVKLSRFISLILRHKPQEIGVELDNYGWLSIDKLLKGMNNKGRNIDMEVLERIVKEDDKHRYSFNEDKTKIRANQGHSININLELESIKPPKELFHGTAQRNKDSIFKSGITKQQRQFVHLSSDIETAIKVGQRHGEVMVLKIDAESMYEYGYKFYLSENKVWLTDYVPVKYIKCI